MHVQPDEATKVPGRAGEVARGVGRLLGRLVAFAVVIAAGVAGWFGVEQYVFPDLPGTLAAPVNETPWPDEFAQRTTTWESFTLSYVFQGVETHRTSFDAPTKRVRIAYNDDAGALESDVELAGLQGFERVAGSDAWVVADPAAVEEHVYFGVGAIEPVHLSELVRREVHPFTQVQEIPQSPEIRRFEVIVDIASLRAANPIAYYRLEDDAQSGFSSATEYRMTADVRADGYIVRLDGRSSSTEMWSDFPADLVFESPLAARNDDAVAAETATTVAPPGTGEGPTPTTTP